MADMAGNGRRVEEREARPPTLKDVAQLAGVSISTASRVLSGQHNVRDELATLVRSAAHDLDYRPNLAARSLRMSRSMVFGTVFASLDSPTALGMLAGLEAASGECGYVLMSSSSRGNPETFQLLMDRLFDRHVDALFLYRPPANIQEQLDQYAAADIPVFALHQKPRGMRIPLVTNRPTESIAQVVDLLAGAGHRRIAYLALESDIGDYRSELLQQSSEHHRIHFEIVQIDEQIDDIAASADALATVLDRPSRPTALFARHRHIPGILVALREREMRIPADMSLVSFGDGPWLRGSTPSISAIHASGTKIGRAAVEHALEVLDGSEPQRRYEPTEAVWIERDSIGPAPVPGVVGRLRRLLG